MPLYTHTIRGGDTGEATPTPCPECGEPWITLHMDTEALEHNRVAPDELVMVWAVRCPNGHEWTPEIQVESYHAPRPREEP